MAVKALLLSAGLGTRLRPYTLTLPKPCIPFWGLPMMYYSFYLLKQTDTREVVINLHHLPEKIKQLVAAKNLSDFKIDFSLEQEKPYGSGGALYYAKNFLKTAEHFFAINSDEVIIPTTPQILNRLRDHHIKEKALATLLVTDHPDLLKTLKPVWINEQGVVRAFGARPETTEVLKPVHYTGYKIFNSEVLEKIPPGETHIFHEVLVPAMKMGAKVCTLHDAGQWWETGNVASLIKAVSEVMHSHSHQKYIQGVFTAFNISYNYEVTLNRDYALTRDKDVDVKGLKIMDTVFLDKGAVVLPQSLLQNVIIGENAKTGSLQNQMLLPGESSC